MAQNLESTRSYRWAYAQGVYTRSNTNVKEKVSLFEGDYTRGGGYRRRNSVFFAEKDFGDKHYHEDTNLVGRIQHQTPLGLILVSNRKSSKINKVVIFGHFYVFTKDLYDKSSDCLAECSNFVAGLFKIKNIFWYN